METTTERRRTSAQDGQEPTTAPGAVSGAVAAAGSEAGPGPEAEAATGRAPGLLPGLFRRMVTELISLVTGWLVWMLGFGSFLVFMRLMQPGGWPIVDRQLGIPEELPLLPRLIGALFVMMVVLPAAARCADQLQHSRATHLLGETLRPPPTPDGRPWWRCLVLRKDRTKPGMLGRVVAGAVVSTLLVAATVACTVTAVVLLVLSLTSDGVPTSASLFHGRSRPVLTILAVVVLAASPWIVHRLSQLDRRLLRAFYGTDETARLQARLQHVEEARSDAVAAADAERRRIERDLHDGAQQRLTALAVDLGLARRAHAEDPETLRETLTRAQSEVTCALQEIRDLVRGLHPAVLEDRGLDAAVSALAGRAPLPVRVDVAVEPRPAVQIEAAAYFVVAEALTNTIAHSEAQSVGITIRRVGDELTVTVVDDGRGGADPSSGTGLDGLRRRVNTVDGTLQISSPADGGTQVQAVLPCA